MLFGPVQDPHHLTLTDAVWWEKVAAFGLIISIAIIGLYPLWISNMIGNSLDAIVKLF
jgi:NADH-quinone oxidoreductase subunit M